MVQTANGDEHHPGRAVVYGWKSGMGGSGAEGGIVSDGVAQVLDDWAVPFSFRARSGVGESVLFVARSLSDIAENDRFGGMKTY